jgi:hypothetical protein
MNNNVDRELEKRAEVLSNGAKQAIVLCAESFRFGGNWGFLRSDNRDFRGIIEALKEEKANIKPYPVSNGAIIVCNKNFLASAVNSAIPNAINGNFIEKAQKRSEVEKQKYVKFLDDVAKGKSRFARQGNGYIELVLGIYCVNDTNFIRLNNIDYPAYKLNLQEAMEYARFLGNKGKAVYIKAVNPTTGATMWGTIEELGYDSKKIASVYKAIEIAESNTGAFITFRIK